MTRADQYRRFVASLKIRTQDLCLRRLTLNPAQQHIWEKIQYKLDHRQRIWVIVLKARREGVSTLCESLLVSRLLMEDRVHSLIMANVDKNTNEIWQMAKTMISTSKWTSFVKFAKREMQAGHSKLTVQTASTPDAMRGFDLTCFHGSEVAFWDYPDTLRAVLQCLADHVDTFCFLESTPNGKAGRGELFYNEWVRATEGDLEDPDSFIPIFLPWYIFPKYRRPGRWVFADQYVSGSLDAKYVVDDLDDEEKEMRHKFGLDAAQLAWRRYMIKVKVQGNLDKFNSEYPTTAETAFIQSGLPFFRRHEIYPFLQHLRKGRRCIARGTTLETDRTGYIEIFVDPKPGRQYVIGSDSSFGVDLQQRSRSAAEVLDMETMEQVAEYDAATPPHIQAKHLIALGRHYNNAMVCPEIQAAGGGGGREILVYLKEAGYWNIYIDRARSIDRVKQGVGLVYGWETNSKTRPRMITRLREIIMERACIIHSSRLLGQIENFGENDSGKMEALQGQDDLLFAYMIALVARTDNYIAHVPSANQPQTDDVDWAALGLKLTPEFDPDVEFEKHKKAVWSQPRFHRSLGEGAPPEAEGAPQLTYMDL